MFFAFLFPTLLQPHKLRCVLRLALDWVVHRASPGWAALLHCGAGIRDGGAEGRMPAGEEAGICLVADVV